ncbi:MAG: glycosyltransferase family 2 protein [Marinilabiliaceae bacterium]|nr:glycosyltransferase family 2 protein [Marinilabiliaceae bacterium]
MLSIVIITRNAIRDLKICIDSVLESTKNIPHELFVIDNGSTDGTVDILQNYGTQIQFFLLEKNYGVAYARNIGLQKAKGEFIWILDVDTIVNQPAVEDMLKYLENHSECGLCACRLQSELGEVQDSCRQLPYPIHKIRNLLVAKLSNKGIIGKFRANIERKNEKQFYRKELQDNQPFEVEYLIGACQMFRKKLLDEVGFLDDKIFYGPEDADFCLRISRKGYKIVCLPKYSIIHHYNRVSNKIIFSRMGFRHLKGVIYFYFKHFWGVGGFEGIFFFY